jgi:thioredoxin 1
MALEISDANFKQEVEDSKGLTMIDFWAPWCGPCQTAGPIVEALAAEFKDKMKVAKLNVDDNQVTASKFGVMSIPTFVFFKDGKEADRKVGLPSQESLKEIIDRLLAN